VGMLLQVALWMAQGPVPELVSLLVGFFAAVQYSVSVQLSPSDLSSCAERIAARVSVSSHVQSSERLSDYWPPISRLFADRPPNSHLFADRPPISYPSADWPLVSSLCLSFSRRFWEQDATRSV